MTFPEKLRAERASLGLSQEATAALLGVSKSVVEKWERGKRCPLDVTIEGILARLKAHESAR